MPTIEVEVGSDIVEARVTLSVSRLNDILQLLIGSNNTHDKDIEELKAQLAASQERIAALEKNLDDFRPDGDRQQQLESTVDSLCSQLDKMRRDVDNRMENTMRQTKQKNAQYDEAIEGLKSDLLSKTAFLKEATTKNGALAADNKARLDALRIPDVAPLHDGLTALNVWRKDTTERVVDLLRFMSLFCPDRERMAAICRGYGPKEEDVVHEARRKSVAATATALGVESSSSSDEEKENQQVREDADETVEGEKKERLTVMPRSGASGAAGALAGGKQPKEEWSGYGWSDYIGTDRDIETKLKYALTLPPLHHHTIAVGKLDDRLTEYVDYKFTTLSHKLTEKIDKHEIAELANELKDQHSQVRQTVDFLDRRLKENDQLASRVSRNEERIKFLHQSKADSGALDMKADTGIVMGISAEVTEIKDDLADIFARLNVPVNASSPAQAGSGAGAGLIRAGSISGPAGRRLSMGSNVGGGGSDDGRGGASQSKRFTDLAELIAGLERRKADRSELNRLHEYIEQLENGLKPGGMYYRIGGGGGGYSPSQGLDLPTVSPISGHGSHGGLGGTSGGGGPAAAGTGRSTGAGSKTAELPPRSRPTSGDSTTSAPGDNAASAVAPAAAISTSGTAGRGQSPRGGSATTKRIGSGSLPNYQTNEAQIAGGHLDGNRAGDPTESRPVRQYLGRNVTSVHDSTGATVPVSIGVRHGDSFPSALNLSSPVDSSLPLIPHLPNSRLSGSRPTSGQRSPHRIDVEL